MPNLTKTSQNATYSKSIFSTARTILSLLDVRQRRNAYWLLGMMFICAMLEAVGIGMVMPFIALISNSEPTANTKLISSFRDWVDATDIQIIYIAAFTLTCLYGVKNLFLAFTYFLQYRYIFGCQVSVSQKLMRSYVEEEYSFHLNTSSSVLLKNVNEEVRLIFSNVLYAIFQVAIEGLSAICICVALIVLAPLYAGGAIVILGGASAIFYSLIWNRTTKLGKQQQSENRQMISWAQETFRNIKLLKVLGVGAYFVDRYTKSSRAYADAIQYHLTVKSLPIRFLEFLGIAVICLLVSVTAMWNGDSSSTVPALGLFAMAAVRLMPSLNRLIAAMTSIQYYAPAVHAVSSGINVRVANQRAASNAQQVSGLSAEPFRSLELESVSFSYANAEHPAIISISLKIFAGQKVAFVGPSGSGKTTCGDVILGLLEPDSGLVLANGINTRSFLCGWQKQLAYVPQSVTLLDATIRENIAFGIPEADIDDQRVWDALRISRLETAIQLRRCGLDARVGEDGNWLSGGQRQRIGLARAIYTNRPILLLDEATSSLDSETETEIIETLSSLTSITTISIAHRLSTIRQSDIIFLFDTSRLIDQGTFDELLQRSMLFRRLTSTEREIQ